MAISDLFVKVGLPGTVTSLTSPGKAIGATSINIGSATNWASDSSTNTVFFGIRTVNPSNVSVTNPSGIVPGTYTEWKATRSGTTLSNLQLQYGTDQVYAAGVNTQVFIVVSSSRENALVDGLLAEHTPTGAHGNITPTSVTNSGSYNQANGNFTVPNSVIQPQALKGSIVKLNSSGTQTVSDTTGAQTQVTMPTTVYNRGGFTVASSVITVQTAGIYTVSGEVGTTDVINFLAFVVKNGSSTIQTLGFRGTQSGQNGYSNNAGSMSHLLAATDTITLQYQNRSLATSITFAALSIKFESL